MKRYSKIFVGVFHCKALNCNKCPYNQGNKLDKNPDCRRQLLKDVLTILERLSYVINFSNCEIE